MGIESYHLRALASSHSDAGLTSLTCIVIFRYNSSIKLEQGAIYYLEQLVSKTTQTILALVRIYAERYRYDFGDDI